MISVGSPRPLHVTRSVLIAAVLLTACETKVTEVLVTVSRIDITAPRDRLYPGETVQLSATPRSAEGDGLTARTVTWSSSNNTIAQVNNAGLVTAMNPGPVTITASAGGASNGVNLTIVAPPAIGLSKTAVALTGSAGVAGQVSDVVNITNAGGETLAGLAASITYQSGSGWLQAQLSSTTAPANLTVSATAQGLAAGTYQATITVTGANAAPRTVAVTFTVAQSFTLTIAGAGAGTGTVTGAGGINCTIAAGATSGTCSARFATGTSVTLTATPTSPSTFSGWSGTCTVSGNTCVATMTADRTITATFNPPSFALTVLGAGNGSGSVQGTNIACSIANGVTSGTCSASYPVGTNVQLTPTAGASSTFVGWTGCSSVNGNVCTASMTAARTVTARFDAATTTRLTITGSGNGNGTVTGPAGINCSIAAGTTSGTCQAQFVAGTNVTLTATAAVGHTFAGWGGGICGGTGNCILTMSVDRTVSATFTQPLTSITVSPATQQLVVGWYWNYAAVARDANNNVIPGVAFLWSSTNPSVATVDPNTGQVTAVSQGTTTIRATYGGVTGQGTLTVSSDPCAAIGLVPSSTTINASLGTGSCMASGNPSHFFAFSSTQPFSMQLTMTSSAFQLSSFWYLAQGFVPVRSLGGLFEAPTATTHTNLAILPAGSYAVELRSYDGRTGSYDATFDFGVASPQVTLCQYAFLMTPVDYNGSISATDCAPRSGASTGYYDRFVLNLRAGETITIGLSSSSVDTYIELYSGAGTLLDDDDDSGGGTNSLLVYTATTAGLVIIEATTFSPGEVGNYRLTVTSNMAAATTLQRPLLPGMFDDTALPTVSAPNRTVRLRPAVGGIRGWR